MDIAVDDRYITVNPMDNALSELKRARTRDKKKKKALTLKEQTRILEFVKNHPTYNRWYPLLSFLLSTRLRIGEATGLRCKASIGGYTDFIFLNRFGLTLNNATVNKVIRRIVRDYNDAQFLMADDKDCKSEMIIVPMFSCHILRHTFATRMIEAGVNVKVIQDLLGHTDVKTTLNIYVDATKELKEKEIMEHGVLTDKCKQKVYEFYKEEKKIKECMNARKDIEFDKAKDANEFGDLRWEKLHCIEGINALVDNQEINIGKQLTLIYGENGSGKTGYVRLLNNAFLSKGDDSLVPDINSENPKEPKAEFEFSNQKESICLKYPDDRTSPVFNNVRIFDTVSALSDLQDENKVDFAPTELKLFDKISDAIIELNAEIEKEIQENKIENSFA